MYTVCLVSYLLCLDCESLSNLCDLVPLINMYRTLCYVGRCAPNFSFRHMFCTWTSLIVFLSSSAQLTEDYRWAILPRADLTALRERQVDQGRAWSSSAGFEDTAGIRSWRVLAKFCFIWFGCHRKWVWRKNGLIGLWFYVSEAIFLLNKLW